MPLGDLPSHVPRRVMAAKLATVVAAGHGQTALAAVQWEPRQELGQKLQGLLSSASAA